MLGAIIEDNREEFICSFSSSLITYWAESLSFTQMSWVQVRFMQMNLCPRHLSPEFPPSKSLQLIRHSHRWRNRPKMTKLFTFLQLPSGSGHSPWCTAAVKQTWNLHQTTWWLFCRDGQVRSAHAEGDDFNNYMHWKLFQAVAQELFFCI